MAAERRLRLFIYARVIVTFLFLASTVALNLQDPAAIEDHSNSGIVRLMAFSFLFSVASLSFLRFQRFRAFITYLQTIWDLLFVTVLLLFSGAATSPYSFLYLLSIMNAGVLLGRREAIYTASLCGILYGAIMDLQFFGLLAPIGLPPAPALQLGATRILYNIFINLMGFYLAAFITGYLARMARESEDALREKTVDYEELERLSSSIVAHMESGLLTVTPRGRIRVFNKYAENVTGRTQAEVYDRGLIAVFPELAQALGNLGSPVEGETTHTGADGAMMIIGYNAVPFTGTHGAPAGMIVSFRDLTGIKRMEDALKRADRLAALGELSARMAHEIRNPLAAMSGSVQLLAEHGSIDDSDRRLLEIVLRESDRLNLIITEFLAYARPAAPVKEPLDFRGLVDELSVLLAADRRFSGIEIVNSVAEGLVIHADGNQMRQVLLNLLHNAADAMPHGGRVEVAGRYVPTDTSSAAPAVEITVTDTGPGVSPEAAGGLFEPFSTTKPNGTGLGLAISYRIIESHGGSIHLDSPGTGGCRIVMALPVAAGAPPA